MDLNNVYRCLERSSVNKIEYYENGKKHIRTFGELRGDVLLMALLLKQMGLAPGRRVGLWGKNSIQWIVIDLACVISGIVVVPLDANHSYDMQEVMAHYELSLLVVQPDNAASARDPRIVSFGELAGRSENSTAAPFVPFEYGPDDIFTVISTSGTGGHSKAIELRKKSFDHLITGSQELFGFKPKDRFLVFLPLHIYLERVYIFSAILLDFDIILTPIEYVFQSIQKDKPTVLIGIPYFFENVQKGFVQKVRANFMGRILYALFNTLYDSPFRFLVKNGFFLFRKAWGGKMRYLLTGAAPIRKSTLDFYKRMGVTLYEGYGMSEIGGMITLNAPGRVKLGSVGKPFPGKEVLFDPDGQILVRSRLNANTAYYKGRPEDDQRTYLEGNTVATGDLGYMDDEGYVYINGRCKDLIVLSTGVKVYPTYVEERLLNSGLFENCLVSGDNRPYLVGLLVPIEKDKEAAYFREAIERINKGLDPTQRVINFHLHNEPFSLKNGMLTSSLKINRSRINADFSTILQNLY